MSGQEYVDVYAAKVKAELDAQAKAKAMTSGAAGRRRRLRGSVSARTTTSGGTGTVTPLPAGGSGTTSRPRARGPAPSPGCPTPRRAEPAGDGATPPAGPLARYFYDCEFIEDGRTIDLVSIGVVARGRPRVLRGVHRVRPRPGGSMGAARVLPKLPVPVRPGLAFAGADPRRPRGVPARAPGCRWSCGPGTPPTTTSRWPSCGVRCPPCPGRSRASPARSASTGRRPAVRHPGSRRGPPRRAGGRPARLRPLARRPGVLAGRASWYPRHGW